MRDVLLLLAVTALLIITSCSKNDLLPPSTGGGPSDPDSYTNLYAGKYVGMVEEKNSGVIGKVVKNDTSYEYTLTVVDGGGSSIVTIEKGPIILPTDTVNPDGSFVFTDYDHTVNGIFVNDSLYLYSKALNGHYDTIDFSAQWFNIQHLSFAGGRQF